MIHTAAPGRQDPPTLPARRLGLETRTDNPSETASYPLPDRNRAFLLGAEVVASVIVASLVSGLVQWVVDRLPIPLRSNVPTALTWSVVFVLSCVALALLWRRWSRAATVAAWVIPAALTSTVQALQLFGTSLYLNGTNGDQFFRMQYFQRLTVSPSLADDNYAGLPPYYPAGWFWLGGRFANLIGHPAWAAYKPFAILTIAAMSSLSFVLWSLIVPRRKAFGVAVVLSLAGTILGPYEPYSWVAITFLPPLAVLAWRFFRSVVARSNATGLGPAAVLIGIGLSITAATYTLVFGFAVLLVVAAAVVAAVMSRLDGSFAHGGRTVGSLIMAVLGRLVLIGLAALPITLLVWAPYLYSRLRLPSAGNAAAQFFPIGMAELGTPMLSPSITGIICVVGLAWIILAWRRSSVAQAFGITGLACVAWQLMSTLALADHTTLLSSHIAKVGEVVLWCACAFALFDLTDIIPRRFRVGNPRSMQVLVSVLAVTVAVALTQTPPTNIQALFGGAFNSYDADGHAASASANSPGKYNKSLIQTIARMSGRQPQDNILLTNDYQLLDFQPYHSFQTNKEQYANPLARYPERNQELVAWSKATTAAEFVSDLAASRFTAPNVFVFGRDSAGDYPFNLVATDFPYDNTTHRITFSAKLFKSSHFTSQEVGPFTVIVRTDSGNSPR